MKKDVKTKKEGLRKKTPKGITLVALVITIIIIIILATVTINMAFGENGLITQTQLAKDMAENSITSEQEEMNALMQEYANIMAEDSEISVPDTTLPTDGSYSSEKGVNTPNIGINMELVVFDEETQEWVTDETNSGYSYVDTSISGNENASQWANAKVTIDGVDSYFVWIPRFAYKITYYTDANKTTTSSTPTAYGTIDIKFINGTGNTASDGTICKYASESPDVTQEYVVHPAFTSDVDNGGWDTELAGIWIGKYETSLANKTDESNVVTSSSSIGSILLSENTDKILVVKPGYTSWRYCTIGNMYTNALSYSTDLKSHMLKNSEWGAVAYLTESKYGRNGTEIKQNTNSSYYTGGGSGTAYITNVDQSSTGNVYGIYDLSGGAFDHVAAYYSGGSTLTTYGSSFANGTSDAYSTAYTGTTASTAYKYGDATYETSGWHSDTANFVYSSRPFFTRGGSYGSASTIAGVFCFNSGNGSAPTSYSFRLALVV